ncbi:hypothetical protein HHX47_DHR4000207 [Lentinula edodes]|nr:hypothetical protein HHX47_DHR4000207 [Lentinula edodes]
MVDTTGMLLLHVVHPSSFSSESSCTDQTTALNAWHSVNGAQLTVIEETVPVSSALPNALSVVIPSGSSGQVGVGNEGYFGEFPQVISTIRRTHDGLYLDGFQVSNDTYNASFFYRFPVASSFNGTATVGLQTSTGEFLGGINVTLSGSQTSWLQVNTTIQPTITPDSLTNNFTVTVDGAELAGQTINFAMFSLFPPTFKNRPNGMRIDIAEVSRDIAPT